MQLLLGRIWTKRRVVHQLCWSCLVLLVFAFLDKEERSQLLVLVQRNPQNIAKGQILFCNVSERQISSCIFEERKGPVQLILLFAQINFRGMQEILEICQKCDMKYDMIDLHLSTTIVHINTMRSSSSLLLVLVSLVFLGFSLKYRQPEYTGSTSYCNWQCLSTAWLC